MPYKDKEKARAKAKEYGRNRYAKMTPEQKQAHAEYQREYRRKNPDKVSAWDRKYYLSHTEELLEKNRQYYEKNKEKRIAQSCARQKVDRQTRRFLKGL